MELKKDEFQCSMCLGVFKKSRSDEEAINECKEVFGETLANNDNLSVVCDDCYRQIDPSIYPDLLTRAIEKMLSKLN